MKSMYLVAVAIIGILVISGVLASSDIPIIEVDESELVKLKLKAADEDGDNLTYEFSDPLDEDGEWQTEYGDAGEYMTKVTVSDGKAETEKQVKIIVHRSNRPPKLEEIEDIVIKEGETVEIDPQAEDEDKENLEYSISEPVGDDGIWETGYEDEGEYRITITASDKKHTVSKEFTITVKDRNRDPNIKHYSPEEDSVDIKEGEELEFEVEAEDPDEDEVDYLWKLDDEKVSEENTYTYAPSYDSAGLHNVQVDVSDKESILRKIWTIEVEDVNRPPVLENIKNITVKEGETVNLDFSAEDPDGDEILYSISEPIGSDKKWETTYDDAGTYDIEVLVSDGDLEVSQEISITVLDVDRAPVFQKIDDITITEEEKVIINLEAEDPDGDEINFSAENLPEKAVLEDNVLEFAPDYTTFRKPDSWFAGILRFLRADDLYYGESKVFRIDLIAQGKERSAEQRVNIKVKNVNLPPEISGIEDVHVDETEKVDLDPEADDPDNDRIWFTAADPLGDDLEWKTGYEDSGNYTINITATDGEKSTAKEVNIIVSNKNRLPEFGKYKQQKIKEGEEATIPLKVSDPDDDPLEVSLETAPQGMRIVNSTLRYKPSFDKVQNTSSLKEKAVILATDSKDTVKKEIFFDIENINRKPIMLAETDPSEDRVTAYAGKPVLFDAVVTDPDGDDLEYTWKFSAFNKVQGSPKMKRVFRTPGEKTVALIISDGKEEIKKEWLVDVRPRKAAPKAPKPAGTGKVITIEIDNSQVS